MSNPQPAKRFRMIAGPNGSGKSSLKELLTRNYAVNFYTFLNADNLLAEVQRTGRCFAPVPVADGSLASYAAGSSYPGEIKNLFASGAISVARECIIFDPAAINSYTIALVANFLQDRHIAEGVSFSQETVFSHPSKIEALKKARSAGFRTYFYFVSTDSPEINLERVDNRALQGGHDVPADKIIERYSRSLSQALQALPYADRAYFFDNSTDRMVFLAQWELATGMTFHSTTFPNWFNPFLSCCPNPGF